MRQLMIPPAEVLVEREGGFFAAPVGDDGVGVVFGYPVRIRKQRPFGWGKIGFVGGDSVGPPTDRGHRVFPGLATA